MESSGCFGGNKGHDKRNGGGAMMESSGGRFRSWKARGGIMECSGRVFHLDVCSDQQALSCIMESWRKAKIPILSG